MQIRRLFDELRAAVANADPCDAALRELEIAAADEDEADADESDETAESEASA